MDDRLRILIIDDDDVDRTMVRRALEASGVGAVFAEAATGDEALAALRGGTFDCALLDDRLGDQDGRRVLAEARAAGVTTPVVLLTTADVGPDVSASDGGVVNGSPNGDEADPSTSAAAAAATAGISDFLSKRRLSRDLLAHAVRNAVRLHRAQSAADQARAAAARERGASLAREQAARAAAEGARAAADQARAAAEASERQYRFLADSMPQIVFTADADGNPDYYNRRWAQYTGLWPEDGFGDRWHRIVHPDDLAACLDEWAAARREPRTFECEYRLRRRDGAYRWHLARAEPMRGVDGRVIKWLGTCTDVDDGRRAAEAARFLAEASGVLASSLDYEQTLATVTRLAVPHVADFCAVDMPAPDGTIRRLAMTYGEERRGAIARELVALYPPRADDPAPVGVPNVLRTGRPELYPEVPDAALQAIARDERHLRMMRDLGMVSGIIVPLAARGRVLGAITFITAESGRRYGPADLALAEDLARRAAVAVDNARLYRDARDAVAAEERTTALLRAETASTEALYRISQILAAELDLDKVVQTVTDEAAALTGARFGAFFYNVLDEKGAWYTLCTLSGERGPIEASPMPRTTAAFALTASTFAGRGVVRSDDITADARYAKNPPYSGLPSGQQPVRSYLAVPVVGRSGEVVGGLFFGHPDVGVFTDRAERLAAGIAAQAAVAIDSARLYQAARESERQYRLLAESLRVSRERLDLVVEASSLGLWYCDLPFDRLDWNDKCKAQFGLPPDADVTINSFYERMHPDDREPTRRAIDRAIGDRSPFDTVYRTVEGGSGGVVEWSSGRVKDQGTGASAASSTPSLHHSATPPLPRIRWIRAIGRAFYDDDAGRPTRFDGITVDVTAQKETEQELIRLKDAAELSRAAAESANAAKDQFLAVLSHELRTPLTPVLSTVQALEDEGCLPAAARPSLEMIRRNVELEARLIDDLLDLTRIAKGKLELDLNVADVHEALAGAVDICRGDALDKGLRLAVDLSAARHHVRADAARLHQVFWNLLKNAIKFTDAGGAITVRTYNGGSGGVVEWSSGGVEDRKGQGTAEEVSSGSSTPSLHHSTTPLLLPDRLIIEVRDTGIGIEPELLPRIFDAFEQGQRAITRQFGGLGLGLAISKVLVDMQGGRLTADSPGRGRGAVFTVDLATSPPPTARAATAPRGPSVAATGATGATGATAADPRPGLRILLVDDHVDTATAMRRLLKTQGYDVAVAHSVAEALDALTGGTAPFDLLVSDIGLPDGSGTDIMREIRVRGSSGVVEWSSDGVEGKEGRDRSPISTPPLHHTATPPLPLNAGRPLRGIALSGFGMEEDVRRSKEAGFVAHLTKPVNFQKLKAVIRQVTSDA